MNVRLVCAQNGEPSRTIEDFAALLAYGRGHDPDAIRSRFRVLVPRPLSYWGLKTANGLPRIG
jgi:hypothetical protein